MINLENAKTIKTNQPYYWQMLVSIAEEEMAWLNSSSKEELDEKRTKRFQKLHQGLMTHNIINNISSKTSLLMDLETLIKIS